MSWVDRELQEMHLGDERLLDFRTMFACARTLLENSETRDPRHLSGLLSLHSPDWHSFLDLLHENRLTPVAYRALRTLSVSEPNINALCDALKQRWQQNSALMLKVSAELVRLVRRFSENAIRVVAFKGPALAMQIYNQINMRSCGDLDFLVWPDDYERAERLLLQDGYTYLPGEVAFKRSVVRKPLTPHTCLVHQQNHTHVEIHFALLHETDSSAFNFDDLWGGRVFVPVANSTVPTLPLPLHALYLTIHGEAHGWGRLGWLYDVAAIVGRMSPEEIAGLIVLAEGYGQKIRLMNALLLTHLLFGLNNIPDGVRARMSNSSVRAYVKLALQMTTAPVERPERPLGHRYWLKKRIGWTGCATAREKWRRLAVFFMPIASDIVRFPLPDRLYGLHYFLRPFWALKRKVDLLLKQPKQ